MILNSIFIEGSLLLERTKKKCNQNVQETEGKFDELGNFLNLSKSVKEPCQEIQQIIINSVKMIVTLPEARIVIIIQECEALINRSTASIRLVPGRIR